MLNIGDIVKDKLSDFRRYRLCVVSSIMGNYYKIQFINVHVHEYIDEAIRGECDLEYVEITSMLYKQQSKKFKDLVEEVNVMNTFEKIDLL